MLQYIPQTEMHTNFAASIHLCLTMSHIFFLHHSMKYLTYRYIIEFVWWLDLKRMQLHQEACKNELHVFDCKIMEQAFHRVCLDRIRSPAGQHFNKAKTWYLVDLVLRPPQQEGKHFLPSQALCPLICIRHSGTCNVWHLIFVRAPCS